MRPSWADDGWLLGLLALVFMLLTVYPEEWQGRRQQSQGKQVQQEQQQQQQLTQDEEEGQVLLPQWRPSSQCSEGIDRPQQGGSRAGSAVEQPQRPASALDGLAPAGSGAELEADGDLGRHNHAAAASPPTFRLWLSGSSSSSGPWQLLLLLKDRLEGLGHAADRGLGSSEAMASSTAGTLFPGSSSGGSGGSAGGSRVPAALLVVLTGLVLTVACHLE
jgi:hypothetical protein